MSHVLISAAHKSSGKTTISIGLCAALTNDGHVVAPFKKGPDYIDPMWLSQAANRPCYNLDFYTMEKEEILSTTHRYSEHTDISIIEGNKGLYDGLDLDGSNSNAALATLLNAPVVLVIDAQGMTRGIAPLILGYQAFEKNINIAGVILNKLGGSRHETKLRNVIEHYTNVPVIGAVHRDSNLQILERHLGLIPSNESGISKQQIDVIANSIKQQVNLDRFIEIANSAKLPKIKYAAANNTDSIKGSPVRIGIIQDSAFGFYYPEDLAEFANVGAKLVKINSLRDSSLPDIDGLFIGGGFPETHMEALQANTNLRDEIRHAIQSGLPTYAECGGLMYLSRSIQWHDKQCEMVGAIPADTVMHKKPQGRGYVRLIESEHAPWGKSSMTTSSNNEFFAHEFHYSALTNIDKNLKFAYRVKRGEGIDGEHDGLLYKNVLGSYVHLRNVKNNRWVSRFINFVRQIKSKQPSTDFQQTI